MELVAPVGPVYQAGTLSANPVGMVAGLATLRKLKKTNPYAAMEKRVEQMGREMEATAAKKGIPFKAQSEASIFWGVFHDSGTSTVRSLSEFPKIHKERYQKLFHGLLNRGFYLAPSAFEVGFISTAHTDSDLERFLKAFGETVGKV